MSNQSLNFLPLIKRSSIINRQVNHTFDLLIYALLFCFLQNKRAFCYQNQTGKVVNFSHKKEAVPLLLSTISEKKLKEELPDSF